jgi:hypothetical protein
MAQFLRRAKPFVFLGDVMNRLRRLIATIAKKTKAPEAQPERAWTPQDFLFDAKGTRVLADFELADAIAELCRFDDRHPPAMNLGGRIVEQFYPEQRKPYAARVSRAHAALMAAIAREDEVIRQYAPSQEARHIGGIRIDAA